MEYCELCGVWGLYQRCYGFLFIARWILYHSYYCSLMFFYPVLSIFSKYNRERDWKINRIRIEKRPWQDENWTETNWMFFFFFQFKFKIRLDVSCFSQKIKGEEYLTCIQGTSCLHFGCLPWNPPFYSEQTLLPRLCLVMCSHQGPSCL